MLLLCTFQCYPWGEGGERAGFGDFDIFSKLFVKNHSPGTTYFVKKHKNPHPRAGEVCQMFLPRGNAIHSRHQISAPWGKSIKSKATPSGMNALSKSPPLLPPPPFPWDNIHRCIMVLIKLVSVNRVRIKDSVWPTYFHFCFGGDI